ncbi:MAG: hypothetical protein KDD67_09655 [Ignavibacteriae bacterium]|nr:hypothetical protein [Ignavibacteriota bacterium]
MNILRCRTDVEFLSAWTFTIFTQEANNYRSAPEGRIVAWPWGKPLCIPFGADGAVNILRCRADVEFLSA